MKIEVSRPEDIGGIVRATRKANGMRQDYAAGSIGVSENFLGKVERGSDSVMWGKLFQVLSEMGLKVIVDVPDAYADETQLELLKLKHMAAMKGTVKGRVRARAAGKCKSSTTARVEPTE